MLTLRYNFNFPRVMGTFGVRAFTSPDAITPCLEWEGDRLIKSYENSRGLKNISLFLSPQIEIVPDWLSLSGTLQYRAEQMSGKGYRRWEFTAGMICPFTKYDRGSKSLNKYNMNSTHVRLDMSPMPFIQIRYNIQWGRQKRGAEKLVNADANVDKSSAGGR